MKVAVNIEASEAAQMLREAVAAKLQIPVDSVGVVSISTYNQIRVEFSDFIDTYGNVHHKI